MATKETMTTAGAARHFGLELWQIQRVYERGLLPDPPRFGHKRVIYASDLPRLEQVLRQVGYLKEAASVA